MAGCPGGVGEALKRGMDCLGILKVFTSPLPNSLGAWHFVYHLRLLPFTLLINGKSSFLPS